MSITTSWLTSKRARMRNSGVKLEAEYHRLQAVHLRHFDEISFR